MRMKKIVPMIAVALFAMTFCSCKKNYVCTCNLSGVFAVKYDLENKTRSQANASCEEKEVAVGGVKYECALE
jgi:hypothetical protein